MNEAGPHRSHTPVDSSNSKPICRARGRAVLLTAQLERDGGLLFVTDLLGLHADGFGDPVLLALADEWRLIEVALGAVERAS